MRGFETIETPPFHNRSANIFQVSKSVVGVLCLRWGITHLAIWLRLRKTWTGGQEKKREAQAMERLIK